MYVKLSPGDLNTGPCPPHSISTCICEVTNAPRVYSGIIIYNLIDTTMGKDIWIINVSIENTKKCQLSYKAFGGT